MFGNKSTSKLLYILNSYTCQLCHYFFKINYALGKLKLYLFVFRTVGHSVTIKLVLVFYYLKFVKKKMETFYLTKKLYLLNVNAMV